MMREKLTAGVEERLCAGDPRPPPTATASRTGPTETAPAPRSQTGTAPGAGLAAPAAVGQHLHRLVLDDRQPPASCHHRSAAETITMLSAIEVGLAVTSHSTPPQLATAVFDNVTFNPTQNPPAAAVGPDQPDRHPGQQPGGAQLDRLHRRHQLHRQALDRPGRRLHQLHRPRHRHQLHQHRLTNGTPLLLRRHGSERRRPSGNSNEASATPAPAPPPSAAGRPDRRPPATARWCSTGSAVGRGDQLHREAVELTTGGPYTDFQRRRSRRDQLHQHRPDQRHALLLCGHRHQQHRRERHRRTRPAATPQAPPPPARADQPDRHRGQHPGGAVLDGGHRRHQLHREAVGQDHRGPFSNVQAGIAGTSTRTPA